MPGTVARAWDGARGIRYALGMQSSLGESDLEVYVFFVEFGGLRGFGSRKSFLKEPVGLFLDFSLEILGLSLTLLWFPSFSIRFSWFPSLWRPHGPNLWQDSYSMKGLS